MVAQVDFYTRHEERSLVKLRQVTSNDVEKLRGATTIFCWPFVTFNFSMLLLVNHSMPEAFITCWYY